MHSGQIKTYVYVNVVEAHCYVQGTLDQLLFAYTNFSDLGKICIWRLLILAIEEVISLYLVENW